MPLRLAAALTASLLCTAPALASDIFTQERSLLVDTFAMVFDDPITAADAVSTTDPGEFDDALDVTAARSAAAVNAKADQNSIVDPGSRTFDATGNAVGSLYIQGMGTTEADNVFRVTFGVGVNGRVTFTLINLIVDDAFGGEVAHDRPADAEVVVRIVALPTGGPVFEQRLDLDDDGTYQELLIEDALDVAVAPGTYTLEIHARVTDMTDGIDQVEFGLAAASYDVRGFIIDDDDIDTTAPPAPTGLTALRGDSVVHLDWDDSPARDLQEYAIYRSTEPRPLDDFIEIDRDDPSSFSDPFVENGTKYYYFVTARDDAGNESGPSNVVCATPTDCPWDLNGDGDVGPPDLAALLDAWGLNPGADADFNADGIVGPADLAALLDRWGECF